MASEAEGEMSSVLVATLITSMVAVVVAVAGLLAAIFRRGQNEGRLTEILSELRRITSDHESRIRILEQK